VEDKVMISPNYSVTKLTKPITIDTYIDIFEDRTIFWFIKPAHILSEYEHGGYSILSLLGSYFESYAQYEKGKKSKNKSKEFFRFGFLSVFPDIHSKYSPSQIDEIIEIMYVGFRCGLFHDGLPRDKIMLTNDGFPITFIYSPIREICDIHINTFRFIKAIEIHFHKYIEKLLNPTQKELRENIKKAFKNMWG